MDTTTLTHILDLLRPTCPDVKWSTDDEGNVILLTNMPLDL